MFSLDEIHLTGCHLENSYINWKTSDIFGFLDPENLGLDTNFATLAQLLMKLHGFAFSNNHIGGRLGNMQITTFWLGMVQCWNFFSETRGS